MTVRRPWLLLAALAAYRLGSRAFVQRSLAELARDPAPVLAETPVPLSRLALAVAEELLAKKEQMFLEAHLPHRAAGAFVRNAYADAKKKRVGAFAGGFGKEDSVLVCIVLVWLPPAQGRQHTFP